MKPRERPARPGPRASAVALFLTLLVAAPICAQSVALQVGRFLADEEMTVYRAGVALPLTGPIGVQLHGTTLQSAATNGRNLWGIGVDATLFQGGRRGVYAIGGVSGGAVTGGGREAWGSWSAGLGYEAVLANVIALGVEGRWRDLSWDRQKGMEVSARLGLSFGTGSSPPPRGPLPPRPNRAPLPLPPPRAGAGVRGGARVPTIVDSVLATARDAMGRRYQFGGVGEGDDGFDCSGLIQYAYGEHGITLPRRSVDQAKQGNLIDRRLDALRPGDILTFSNRGGVVTHVGLYLGRGKFIHSASRGVQESTLSDADPYGRWWYQRWVGARRVVE